jgi:hypothetical protein
MPVSQPARGPEPRGAKLSRQPSNSAASGRLSPVNAPRQGGDAVMAAGVQPVDISQLRNRDTLRQSSVATSSDAGYAGSRYSDLQWDEVAQVMRVGHRAPVLAGADPSSSRSSGGENQIHGNGVTSLIRGNNAKEEATFWDISSSSDSHDQHGNEPTHWVAIDHSSASPRNGTASSSQTRMESVPPARYSGAYASTTRPETLGNFASPLMRHRSRLGAPIQSPNTGTYLAGNGMQSPNSAPKSAPRKVLARPSSTPKVRVPIQSRAAITEDAQLAALANKIAVRNEVDDYIASLKRTIK